MTSKNLDSLPKKTSRVGFLTVSALMILVSHCDSNSGIDSDPEKELVCSTESVAGVLQPFSVGSYWKYSVFGGADPSDSVRIDVTASASVLVDEETISSFEVIKTRIAASPFVEHQLFSNGPDGLYTNGRILESGTLYLNLRMYPFPTFVGEEFQRPILEERDGKLVADRSATLTVISVDEEVITPAGSFSTIVYQQYIRPPSDVTYGDYVRIYFAPGIGPVANRLLGEPSLNLKYEQLLAEYCHLVELVN